MKGIDLFWFVGYIKYKLDCINIIIQNYNIIGCENSLDYYTSQKDILNDLCWCRFSHR